MKQSTRTHTALDGFYRYHRVTGDYSLRVIGGPHQGMDLRLDKEFSRIGRADWCDMVLSNDHTVSNVHCECILEERGVRLRDLGSSNGIALGGFSIVDAYLKDNVEFQLGDSRLQLLSHNQKQEIEISYQDKSGTLVGKSPQMRKIFSMLPRLAQRKVATLLLGGTGTGKTSIAHAIHLHGHDTDAPFVVVNCGALPSGLVESQLFGYEKGSFTGATSSHKGFFQQANGGTLVFDEIGELPLELQPKLLDVIERRKVRPIGSEREYDVDFHLITATLRDLPQEVAEKRFREDLYFRLSVVELKVPSLRERFEDFNLIVEKLMSELCPNQMIAFSDSALRKLKSFPWPGNIRQLRNILERSITFLEGNTVSEDDLEMPSISHLTGNELPSFDTPQPFTFTPSSSYSRQSPNLNASTNHLFPAFPLKDYPQIRIKDYIEAFEREIVARTLEETERDVQEAKELLDVSTAWLYARIRKYQLRTKNKQRESD